MTAQTRHRRWRGPLIFLLLVAVLLVVLDRVALVVAEHRIAAKVQSSQQLDTRPSVSIEGFPFLTQVAAGHFHAATLSAADLVVGDSGRTVRLSTLHARVSGIRTSRNFSSATADQVNGTVTLSYPELSRAVGVNLAYDGGTVDGNGRVKAIKSVSVLGKTVSGAVSAEVRVVGGNQLVFSAIQVGLPQAGVLVPQAITDELSAVFKNQLSLKGLPFGLQIQRLIAGPDGVQVSATAQHVTLS
ncbi:MAG: LmeA family phospholipid-binding protein [Jatrophihabitans sp.]